MGLYAKYVLPKLIDLACGQPLMASLRAEYVPRAEGDVLEIGIGSGHNLSHYRDASTVTGLDPAPELTAMASRRAAAIDAEVSILQASGEDIPADDGQFDSIVCTWTLCSIPNVSQALGEMRRVLKPGGRFYFIEHGLAPEPQVARWQRTLEPVWKVIGGGCHLTRQPALLLEDAGFDLAEKRTGYLPGPKPMAFMTHGVAMR
ncbi:MAG: class I SAM-dependent methyltransferase [Gammaproteobacteria bacterium]|nr:class I SAM-dependent methyltransferase [Gammaproteobacteria bacterium]